ncbi:MAG: DUF421 domain-containing protein [Gammaproteobacteria bacterium]|nr:DUF421 domain-containing protein [Gammaproteobacteria bacterium]
MDNMLFQGFEGLVRTMVVGALAYIGLIFLLRLAGNRTLSKLNAFDLVVTVALGSILATILLNEDVALAEGMVAFGVLMALQYLVTWSSVRFAWVRNTVTGEPALLLHDGRMLPRAMRRARVTRDEIRAAVREAGIPALSSVKAVVLETDGSISVVQRAGGEPAPTALEQVRGHPPEGSHGPGSAD